MKFVKQQTDFASPPIAATSEERVNRHGVLLPTSVRCIICGPSNCGKTNLMLNLLLHPTGLKVENCYVYSKSLHQPKYCLLQRVLERVPGMSVQLFSDRETVLPPDEIKPDSIIIFDDVECENQDIISSYFSMAAWIRFTCVSPTRESRSI